MKNLVEQASSWLQSEPCRSGSIQKRTDAVISLFRSYLSNEKDEIEKITGLSDYAVTLKIDKTQKEINQILSAFLRGNQQDA